MNQDKYEEFLRCASAGANRLRAYASDWMADALLESDDDTISFYVNMIWVDLDEELKRYDTLPAEFVSSELVSSDNIVAITMKQGTINPKEVWDRKDEFLAQIADSNSRWKLLSGSEQQKIVALAEINLNHISEHMGDFIPSDILPPVAGDTYTFTLTFDKSLLNG